MASLEQTTLEPHLAAWELVLDELEASLAMAGEPTTGWVPPAGLGLIPEALVERAQALNRAQRMRVAELESAKRETAAHLTALRSIPALRNTAASVYLDVAG
ncbi:hypothetical protein [Cryobacterium tepidiphilum]|uniref:Flagellar protein FlgN n=1 Tax=Cryobacterium tepidiphilum TaxID=2486026 RepID=A0A3M8LME2_9MICO|nr:hypothetical protein [Cryobacterium tepidiphilum]RNE66686.1 hypothetical protein EEJ31_02530 [Cryobacterium tepidiphilum]